MYTYVLTYSRHPAVRIVVEAINEDDALLAVAEFVQYADESLDAPKIRKFLTRPPKAEFGD